MKRTNQPADGGKQKYRFYRSQLPSIVWDGQNNCVLADFSKGHFTTDNLEVAEILLDKGYVQIPLNATQPPAVLVRIPGRSLKNTNENKGELDDVQTGAPNLNEGVRVPVTQEL